MLKKIVIAVIVLALVIIAFPSAKNYIVGGKKVLSEKISASTPTAIDVAAIESMIEEKAVDIESFKSEITDMDGRIKADQNKVVKLKTAREELKNSLVKADKILSEEKKSYTIKGEEFTRGEVEADAIARIEAIKGMDEQIIFVEALVADLNLTSKYCKKNLAEARKQYAETIGDLKKLQAREVNAEIKAKVAALTTKMSGYSDSLATQTKLQTAMQNYEKKIAVVESKAVDSTEATGTLIDYSGDAQVDSTSTLDKIKAVIG